MLLFTGSYEFTIDAKQRLAIPHKIRAKLDPRTVGTAFYAVRGPNGAVWLWPERIFERMAGSIEASLAPRREVMDFDEMTFPMAEHVEIDTAGRVRLPEEMLAAAGLGQKVVILGVRDHLEVWDPERWARSLREKESRRQDIVDRAGPLLGHSRHPEGEHGS